MGKDAKAKARRKEGKVHLAVIDDVVTLYKKELLPQLDKIVAIQNEETSHCGERPISCTRGCIGCCHQLVLIDLIEAFAIADHVLKKGFVTRALLQTLLDHAEMQNDGTRGKWFESATPCAFLDPETKDCRVYDVRPMACRMYYVISPPENCWPGAKDTNVKSTNGAPAVVVHRKAATELLKAARKRIPQLPAFLGIGPLPTMVTLAMSAITGDVARLQSLITNRDMNSLTSDEGIVGERPGERDYVGYIIARAGLDPEQFGLPRPPEDAPGGEGDVHAADQAAGATGAVPGGVPEPTAT